MSSSPSSPRKRPPRYINSLKEDNNNKYCEQQQAKSFITWYKHMIDNERQNLSLYLSDDAVLEWFGRTIKGKKKVTTFLKFDMQCSKHDFTTVKCIDKILTRQDRVGRKDDTNLASPLNSPEIVKIKSESGNRKRQLRSNCVSPEWAEGCRPQDEPQNSDRKKIKLDDGNIGNHRKEGVKRSLDDSLEHHKGDGVRAKRKCYTITPPNPEVGQGDCLPSTSGTDSDRSHDALNAQLMRLAVECNGYVEFTRSRNSRNIDTMKWERKCKLQMCYSEDPLNVGEYIIWALHYTDESKCKRNLLAAFEEVAMEETKKD